MYLKVDLLATLNRPKLSWIQSCNQYCMYVQIDFIGRNVSKIYVHNLWLKMISLF